MNSKVILLVEDEPDEQTLTLRALRRNNITNEVIVAQDGAEALDYLFGTGMYAERDPLELPAVVILDLNLPRLHGLDVLRCIRDDHRTRLLPVVILSSSKAEDDLIASYRLGANSYIRKPVAFDAFIDVMRQFGLYWLSVNEVPPRSASRR